MSREPDPIRRLLAQIDPAPCAELPDPRLEARLRACHARRPRGARRTAWALAAVAALGGAGYAAASGWSWLRRWWFTVEVDGSRATGSVDGAGERRFAYRTGDGGTALVTVSRERAGEHAVRTRMSIDRTGPGFSERQRNEEVVGDLPRRRWPLAELGDTPAFYSGADYSWYVQPLADGGSRLLLRRHGDDPLPVEELARVPFQLLTAGAEVRLEERADGTWRFSFATAEGAVCEFEWADAAAAAPPVTELHSADGRVRVQIDDAPLPESP